LVERLTCNQDVAGSSPAFGSKLSQQHRRRMEAQNTIVKILKAVKFEDVVDIKNFKHDYYEIVKLIHPDHCSLPTAGEAFSKITDWYDTHENGKKYIDESGEFTTNFYNIIYRHKPELLKKSFTNWSILTKIKHEHFSKYMPSTIGFVNSNLEIDFSKRTIPLSGLTLPQEHVNWILSRLLEYCALIADRGYVHCGLIPESIFIVPETHGIKVCSFYHMTKKGEKVKTVSGINNYLYWYPAELLSNKTAEPIIDLELSKNIARYLLGDKTVGAGAMLRKTCPMDFVDFLQKQHTSALEAFIEYRDILNRNFPKQFHQLNI
jgi:hypothetical protein